MNKIWIPVFAGILLMPGVLRAASIEAKTWELNGLFSYQHSDTEIPQFSGATHFKFSNLDFEPGVGYFLTSHWEVLGAPVYQRTSLSVDGPNGDSDTSYDTYGVQVSAYYHFNTSGAVVPFLGVGFGVLGNGGDDNGDTSYTVPEAIVGIRWPLRNVFSLNFTGGYRHRSTYEDNDNGTDQFFLGAGLSVFLTGGATE